MSLPGKEAAVLAAATDALDAAQSTLAGELIKTAVNAASVVDPTPITKAIGTAMSLADSNNPAALVNAGLSLAAMTPWAGEAMGTLAVGAQAGAQAVQLMAQQREGVAAQATALEAKTAKVEATAAEVCNRLYSTAAARQRSNRCCWLRMPPKRPTRPAREAVRSPLAVKLVRSIKTPVNSALLRATPSMSPPAWCSPNT